jgi:hypothetical protein
MGCAQPIRTRSDQATCQLPISTAITNPILFELATDVLEIRRIYARACQKTPALGIQWVIDQTRV